MSTLTEKGRRQSRKRMPLQIPPSVQLPSSTMDFAVDRLVHAAWHLFCRIVPLDLRPDGRARC
eukprot:1006624-Pyramimonas_sp.AAC.1